MGIGNLGIGKTDLATGNRQNGLGKLGNGKMDSAIWDVTGGNALPCGYIRNQGNATKSSGLYR